MLFPHRPCGLRRKYLLKIIMDRKYINEEKTNWFNVVPNFWFYVVPICPSEIRRSEFPKYIWKNHIWGSWRTNAAKCKINYPSCIGLDLLLRYLDIAFFKMLLWSINHQYIYFEQSFDVFNNGMSKKSSRNPDFFSTFTFYKSHTFKFLLDCN